MRKNANQVMVGSSHAELSLSESWPRGLSQPDLPVLTL